MRSKYNLYIILSLLLLFFCSNSDQTYTIEIKDGVRYVHNYIPKFGDTPQSRLEYIGQIGELESEDENYLLYKPFDVARDADGNIYILDEGNCRVQKFDSDHKYIATIGRRGMGPGEFDRPFRIELDHEGNMYVCDGTNRLVHIFSPDGRYKKGFRFSELSTNFCFLAKDQYVNTTPMSEILSMDKIASKNSLVSIVDEKGTVIKRFGTPMIFNNDRITQGANNFYIEIGSDNNIYIAFRSQNRIEKYSPEGVLIFVVDFPLNFKLFYKMGIQKLESRGRSIEVPIAEISRVSGGLGIDHKSRIWVISYKKQPLDDDMKSDFLEFNVFSTEGLLLFKVSFPNIYCKFIKMYHDRLYLIDTYREMCVYEYKIAEK